MSAATYRSGVTRTAAAPLLAALVALAIAWPAVKNGWSDFDEDLYVRGGFLLLLSVSPSNLARLATSAGPSYQHQPVGAISYAFDHALFGEVPGAFHAVDVALYALLSALVAVYARALARDAPRLARHAGVAGFVAGALFAAHPVHVESYAWICDRKDVLAALLGLAALLVERDGRRASGLGLVAARMVGLLLLALSLGAKVSAMGLGLLVALDAYVDAGGQALPRRARARRAALAGAPYLALGLALSLLWLALQRGFPMPLAEGRGAGDPLLTRAMFSLRCLGHYVRTFAVPVELSVSYIPHPGARAWAWDLVPLLPTAALVLGLAARAGPLRLAAMVGGGWLLVGLGPVLNIVALTFVADRYSFFASVGIASAAGLVVAHLAADPRSRPAILALTAAALVALTIASARRIPVWASADSLWSAAVRVDPLDPNALTCLAAARLNKGDLGGARGLAEVAYALEPAAPIRVWLVQEVRRRMGTETPALEGLSDAYEVRRADQALDRGEHAQARTIAERLLAAYPKDARAALVLGKLLLSEGSVSQARPLLELAALHLADVDATYHAAIAAEMAGDLERAWLHLEVLERAGPTWRSRLLAARLLQTEGRSTEVADAARAARTLLAPADADGWHLVAVALASAGAYPEAMTLLRKHHASGAASPAAIYDLARLEALSGLVADARRHLREAIDGDARLAERVATDPALSGLASP